MATYSLSNFLATTVPGDITLKIYDSYKKLKYEVNPNIAYFLAKSNVVVIRIEDRNDIYLDFNDNQEAALAAAKLNTAKKEIQVIGGDEGLVVLSTALSWETIFRISGDTILSTALSTEISDRISGDTYLSNTIIAGDLSVTNYVISMSGETVIGLPEDVSYADGIFPDFTPTTRVGIAIDRFNEMFKLLAPTPPYRWSTATLNLDSTIFSARELSTGNSVNGITIDTTPNFSVVVPFAGLSDASDGYLSFDVDSVVQETFNVTGSTNKNSGVIRYTSGDPYVGQQGKEGFWTGITSASGISLTLTPSSSLRTANYIHSTKGTISKSFYLDNPLSVTISSLIATVPAMTRYISGVPSLATGDSITGIGFDINNVASYFYAPTYVWEIQANLVGQVTGNPDSIPTTYGSSGTTTNKTATVLTNRYSDTSFTFQVRGRNSNSTDGASVTFTDSTKRVDTVSVENRITSGNGNYPSSWGGTYNSNTSLLTITDEMMLKNGAYQYPSGNYTAFGGPNYTGIANTRWVTFNLGTFSSNAAFTLTFVGSVGITSIGQGGLYVEVKISGATSWVDGDAAYSGVGNPGSGADGVASVVTGYPSTATVRRITFGSITYSGAIIVRVGITGSGVSFSSLTATSLV